MAQRYHHGDLREKLVASALELLHRDHPEDLSIREVARLAGASSGAPYHHFGDKTGLLAACAMVGWKELIAQLEAPSSAVPVVEQLQAQGQAYLDYALHKPGRYRLMMSRLFQDPERFSELREQRALAMRGVLHLIAQSGTAGTDPVVIKQRGVATWSMLHGYALLCLDGSIRPLPTASQQAEAVRLAMRMALLP